MYASQAQEAFLEGHVTAFEVTGGVPFRQIRYDNLSPAVAKVLAGRSRTETARWLLFRAHYGFEAFYCQPGPEGAHEKGGIGGIGRFRRRWFVPVPRAASLAELNARLAEADAAEDARHVAGRAASIGEDFAAERGCCCGCRPSRCHRGGGLAAGGPVCPGQRRSVPVFGACPAHRLPGPGDAVG